MKHTPGPWFLSPQNKYVRASGIHGWNIATIEDQPPYTDANAKLISAAPDLLEALKRILPHAAVIINGKHPDWQFAEAAIKKAIQ